MTLFVRALRGDGRKLSRIHDFAGNRAPAAAFTYLPACLASTVVKKLAGKHPAGPWLGYRAVRRLHTLLQPSWQVLELGAGNSTPWLAERSCRVVSVESQVSWHRTVTELVAGRDNVELILQPPPYDSLSTVLPAAFSLCIVDGVARDRAMELALAKVRPGGYIYLDNSDVQDAEHQRARRLLLAACDPSSVEIFVDFCRGQVSVTQGILARLPSASGVARQ